MKINNDLIKDYMAHLLNIFLNNMWDTASKTGVRYKFSESDVWWVICIKKSDVEKVVEEDV